MGVPLICDAAAEQRKTTVSPKCSTSTNAPEGIFSEMSSFCSCSNVFPDALARAAICCSTRGVRTQPGQMAVQVTPPVGAHSRATACENDETFDHSTQTFHHLCQSDDSVLCCDICRLVCRRDEAMDAGNVDDSSPSPRAHVRQHHARGVKCGAQIDVDDGVPAVGRKGLHRADVLNAGVVYQNVHTAQSVLGGVNQRLHSLRRGEIRVEKGNVLLVLRNSLNLTRNNPSKKKKKKRKKKKKKNVIPASAPDWDLRIRSTSHAHLERPER